MSVRDSSHFSHRKKARPFLRRNLHFFLLGAQTTAHAPIEDPLSAGSLRTAAYILFNVIYVRFF